MPPPIGGKSCASKRLVTSRMLTGRRHREQSPGGTTPQRLAVHRFGALAGPLERELAADQRAARLGQAASERAVPEQALERLRPRRRVEALERLLGDGAL